ncbi:hypothetical protein TNCV_1865191 [Trichonephila clavipes]|nr:hypothetical protein TNCV_1865191 [Trichonephila clavipes]
MRSGEYGKGGRTSQPSSINFCRIIRHMRWRIVLMKHNSLFLDVFVQLLSLMRLIVNNPSLSPSQSLVKARDAGFLSNSTELLLCFNLIFICGGRPTWVLWILRVEITGFKPCKLLPQFQLRLLRHKQ